MRYFYDPLNQIQSFAAEGMKIGTEKQSVC